MVAREGIKTINLYDIFANIIPGFVFLFGLAVPVDVFRVISVISREKLTVSFGLSQLLIIIVLSFVMGQILQAFGSRFDGDHGFDSLVKEIRENSNPDNRHIVTQFDDVFWELCKDEFVLSDDFESHDRLFKAILAYLEHANRTRALRLQALYLFARGVFVAALFLTLYYVIIGVSLLYSYLPSEWAAFLYPAWAMVFASIISTVLFYISNEERKELESDWIKYTLTEFYLETVPR